MVRLHRTAAREWARASDWYAKRGGKALAQRFDEEVIGLLAEIQRDPKNAGTAYKVLSVATDHGDTVPLSFRRLVSTGKFPYVVFYFERAGDATVVAVMHGKRRPDYWNRRRMP